MVRNAINFPANVRSPILLRASTSPKCGAFVLTTCRRPGYSAVEIMEAIHRGEIKALLSICFNPLVSLPDANFTREALSKLEFFGVIDFFLSETAHHADVVLAGSLQEEEEGLGCSAEGRVIHWQKSVDPPGDARCDSAIIVDLARRLGKAEFFRSKSPAEILEELREASPRRSRGLLRHNLREDRRVNRSFLALPDAGTSWHAAIVRRPEVLHPDEKAHFQVTEWRDSGDPVDINFRSTSPPAAW